MADGIRVEWSLRQLCDRRHALVALTPRAVREPFPTCQEITIVRLRVSSLDELPPT